MPSKRVRPDTKELPRPGATPSARPAGRKPTRRRNAAEARRLAPDLRRDLAVLALILLAILSALALLLPGPAPLRLWRDSLLSLFGRAAPLAPAWLLVVAVGWLPGLERFRLGWARLAGGALATAAALGLLHLPLAEPARQAALGEGGGQAGLVIAGAAGAALGQSGAWLALAALLLAGVLVLLNLSLPALARALLNGAAWTVQRLLGAGQWLVRIGRAARAGLRWPARAPRRTLAEEYAAAMRRQTAAGAAGGAARRRATPAASPPAVSPDTAPIQTVPQVILPASGGRRSGDTGPLAALGSARPAGALALWSLPDPNLLDAFPDVQPDAADAQQKARLIDQTLANFRVDARVKEIYPGPSFTQFAVEPGLGVKVRRITELQNDLALALAVPSLRIEAPVPGKSRVGIEIPNVTTATVGLRETLESEEWLAGHARLKLPLVLGRDVSGRPVVVDMTRMPHLLIAGATGSGKSVCLNAIIACLLLQFTPDDLRLVLIDPKRVELSSYNGIPHLQAPVVTDMDKVVGILRKLVAEMERRYELLQRLGVRNIDGYLARCREEPRLQRLPYLLLFVDELADLMMTAPDEVEGQLCRLAQMGRATGIHLILATQRPSVDVVTGLIKANFPSRIAFAVSSQIDSRVILDIPGAERLMGRGDMLYQASDAPKPQRIQGVYLSDEDIPEIVRHWRDQVEAPSYDPEWLNVPSMGAQADGGADDELIEQAIALVRQQGAASASMFQRRLRIGYPRAARLVEQLEQRGIIGPADGRTRAVLDGGSSSLPATDKTDDELPL